MPKARQAASYTYDEVGNRLTQTDANGHTTTWTYDYFGRVTSRTLPETMSERFVYSSQLCAVQPAKIGVKYHIFSHNSSLFQFIHQTDMSI